MKTLEVHGIEDMPLVDAERPVPGPGEVLIAVAYCGICGSDFPRYFEGGVHSFPQTLGHEFSGVVVEAGPDVVGVGIGESVAVAPLVPCHECARCQAGKPSLCPNYSFIGSRRQGALAEYVLAPARNLLKLPEGMSLRDAALVEPLTVAIHGIERATYDGVERVAVYGAGVIGLLTVQALKARGVPHVTSVDVQPDKLALAERMGADATVLGSHVEEEFADPQRAPEVAIETAGAPVTQVQAVSTVAYGGQVVFVGTCTRPVQFEPEQFERILRGELALTGSWMSYSAPFPGHEWTQAVDMIASGAVAVRELVSKEYALDEAAQPFHDVRDAKGSMLKALYRVGGEDAGGRA